MNAIEKNFGWFFYNGYKQDRWSRRYSSKFPNREFKKIAVTGGAGFIGSHLVKLLAEKGCEVTVIDSLTYAGNLKNLEGVSYEFHKIDIRDRNELIKLFGSRSFDAIVHLAAESHVDRSIANPMEFVETNVIGTVNMLEMALLQHEKNPDFFFYHVSTDEVFGSLPLSKFKHFKETTPYDPRSPYSSSKASSDHFVRAYHHTYNLPVVISNCSNNYGTHQYPEKLIPVIVEKLVKREDVPIYGSGVNQRDWLHVKDHAEAIHFIMQKGVIGETYCVGGNNVMNNLDLALKICEIYDTLNGEKDSSSLITFVKDRKGHDLRYSINCCMVH
jgi:dTDP-glucose 4,6-dehydratase